MEQLITTVVEFKEHQSHSTNPFSKPDIYFQVSPRLFSILPLLPATSREILRYISLNIKDGKVYLPVTSLLVYAKVKSQKLVEAGIEALLEEGVIAREEGDSYWVNFMWSPE